MSKEKKYKIIFISSKFGKIRIQIRIIHHFVDQGRIEFVFSKVGSGFSRKSNSVFSRGSDPDPDQIQPDPDLGQIQPDPHQIEPDPGQIEPEPGQIEPDPQPCAYNYGI